MRRLETLSGVLAEARETTANSESAAASRSMVGFLLFPVLDEMAKNVGKRDLFSFFSGQGGNVAATLNDYEY